MLRKKSVLNFASALYLGLYHPLESLRPWRQLTTGMPTALATQPLARSLEKKLARLQGFDRALLGPSTLHLFWDLFGILRGKRITIYLDAGAYPIANWGVERAAASGTLVKKFAHHDSDGLKKLVRCDASFGRQPIIVTDGFCPGCGNAAPLADYVEIVRKFGGYLIIDDTQALGIFGHNPKRHPPYGLGGGGILRWYGIEDPHIINVSSLAKGFGVPLAVLSGSDKFVRRFDIKSETRIHTSPPSIAAIHAAEHALAVNRAQGDRLRKRLARRVLQLRKLIKNAGLVSQGGFFPVQALPVPDQIAERVHRHLRQCGVMTVLQQCCIGHRSCITFVITARHDPDEINEAVRLVAHAVEKVENDAPIMALRV